MPAVSLIMPVYNKALYLADALDSVLAQTFADFELIVIDDGSTDASLEVARAYAQRDARISVYSIRNQGVSHARNLGMSYAKGKYLTFVDADDTIHPSYMENMYACICQSGADMVISGIAKHRDGVIRAEMTCGRVGLFSLQDILTDFASVQKRCGIYGSCVAKLFSRELAQGVQFDEQLKLAEDFDFYLQLYAKAETFYCDDKKYYYYLQETENSSFLAADDKIDYEAQLRISLRYRAFLQEKQAYLGENQSIVDTQISNYVYLTLFHCPKTLLAARFDAIRELYIKERITLCPVGLRQHVVLGLLEKNKKAPPIGVVTAYRMIRRLRRRL